MKGGVRRCGRPKLTSLKRGVNERRSSEAHLLKRGVVYHHATSVHSVPRATATRLSSSSGGDAPPARRCTSPPLQRRSEKRRIRHSRVPTRICRKSMRFGLSSV